MRADNERARRDDRRNIMIPATSDTQALCVSETIYLTKNETCLNMAAISKISSDHHHNFLNRRPLLLLPQSIPLASPVTSRLKLAPGKVEVENSDEEDGDSDSSLESLTDILRARRENTTNSNTTIRVDIKETIVSKETIFCPFHFPGEEKVQVRS